MGTVEPWGAPPHRAVTYVRDTGKTVDGRDVERESPVVRDHIELHGRYSFDLPEVVREGVLRPLPQSEAG